MKKKIDEVFNKLVTDVAKEPRVATAMILFGGNGIGILIALVIGDLVRYANDHKWIMFGMMILIGILMFSFFAAMASIGETAIERIVGEKNEDRESRKD